MMVERKMSRSRTQSVYFCSK